MIIEHFNFRWFELIIAWQECSGVAWAITVTRWGSVRVAKVGVRRCVPVCVVCNVKIVPSSESRSIAVIGVDGIIVVFVHGWFKRFYVVFVAEWKQEWVGRANVTCITCVKKLHSWNIFVGYFTLYRSLCTYSQRRC